MKWLWQKIGILAFWMSFPGLIVYLKRSERTRIVIACEQKIVVVKGWLGAGKWVLPGGGLHTGETPLSGLLREVAEETGLRLESTRVKFLFREVYRYHGIRFPCHYYFVEVLEAAPLHAQFLEIVDIAWVAKNQLDPHTAGPDVLHALRHLAAQSEHR